MTSRDPKTANHRSSPGSPGPARPAGSTWIPVAAALLIACTGACADNWPQWRGPDGTGRAAGTGYPISFSPIENVQWITDLPGRSGSTPVVWEDFIVVTTPVDEKDGVVCLNRAGTLLWTTTLGQARAGKHRNGTGSNPSPVTDGESIFVYFKSGEIAALDFDGRIRWRKNLQSLYGEDTLWWDVGSSPVLTKDNVVYTVLHTGESYLVAFDKQTGDLVWKQDRNYTCPTESDQSYTTPLVLDNRLLVWGADHLTAHDAGTGKPLWECGGFNPDQSANWCTIAGPVVTDGIAVVPYGRGKHLAGIRLGGRGAVTDSHRLWTQRIAGPDVPNPVADDGTVYLLGDKGALTCIEAKTGQTLWSEQLESARPKFYASPILADGHLYTVREDGRVFVVDVRNGFRVAASNSLDAWVVASPVLVDGTILIKTDTHLYCFAGS